MSVATSNGIAALQQLRAEIRTLLEDLVRVNTVAVPPAGDETPAQQVLLQFLERNNVAAELYETEFILQSGSPYLHADRDLAGRKNLVARLKGQGTGRSLLLSGHIDTVPTNEAAWTSSPWEPTEREGNLYGLGTFDMKGGLVAQAAVLAALQQAGIQLNGDLLFESVVDEEWGGGGGTLAGRLRGDRVDACVICESTQLEIYRATRGGLVVDLVCEAGDPSAYFSAGPVVSPAIAVGRLLGWVDSWTKRRTVRPADGAYAGHEDPTPVQVLAVEANRLDTNIPLSVPLTATVRVYFQFLPQEDVTGIEQEIHASLNAFAAQDEFFRQHPIAWKPLYYPPLLGHELAADHPWTECLGESIAATTGKPVVVTAAPYPCDAFLMQRGFNIPTLVFGPSGAGAHNPDEYVNMESVYQTAEILLRAAINWCGVAGS